MKLRARITVMIIPAIVLLTVIFAFFGKFFVKGVLESGVEADLRAFSYYVLSDIKNPVGEDYYYINEEGFLCNGESMVITSEESLAAKKKIARQTDVNVFYTYGDTVVGGTLEYERITVVEGTQLPGEITDPVFKEMDSVYYKNYAIGGERFYLYLQPYHNTGETRPAGMVCVCMSHALTEAAANELFKKLLIVAGIAGAVIMLILILLSDAMIVSPVRSRLLLLEEMSEDLKGVSAVYGEHAAEVKSASENIADSAKARLGESTGISANILELASAVETGEDTSGVVEEIKAAGARGHETLGVIHEKMEIARRVCDETKKSLDAARKLVFDAYDLAVAASVEAALAGESGVRFAQICEQMRQISEQVREDVEKVSGMLDTILIQAHESAENVENTRMHLHEQHDLADVVSSNLHELKNTMESIVRAMGDLARESASGTEETGAAFEELIGLLEQMTFDSQDLSEISDELSENIRRLM